MSRGLTGKCGGIICRAIDCSIEVAGVLVDGAPWIVSSRPGIHAGVKNGRPWM